MDLVKETVASGNKQEVENHLEETSQHVNIDDLEMVSPTGDLTQLKSPMFLAGEEQEQNPGNNMDLLKLENDLFDQYVIASGTTVTTSQNNTDLKTPNFNGNSMVSPDMAGFNMSLHPHEDDDFFKSLIKQDSTNNIHHDEGSIPTSSPANTDHNNNSGQFPQYIQPMATTFSKIDQNHHTNNNNNNNHSNNQTRMNSGVTHFINLTQNSPLPDRPSSAPVMTNKHFTASVMEQKFKSLIEDTLTFGRNKEITSRFIDPQQYIEMDANTLPCHLTLEGLPKVTRVENQLKLSLILTPPPTDKYLVYLPIDSITRERFYLSNDIITYPKTLQEQLLYLDAFILDNHSNANITVCTKCVNREQRRASRRKSKISDNLLWCNNANRRAIIFNNKQISLIEQIDSRSKKIELTTRIVCYCRHHKSENGFKLLFILKDYVGNVLAKTVSNPIIITDRKQQIMGLGDNMNSMTLPNMRNTSVPTLSTADPHVFERNPNNMGQSASMMHSSTMNETSTSNSTTPGQYVDTLDHFQLLDDHSHNNNSHQQQFFNQIPTHQLQPQQQQLSYSHVPNNNTNNNNNNNGMVNPPPSISGRRIIPSPTSMSEDGSESIPTELLYNSNNNIASMNDFHNSNSNSSRKRSRVSMSNVATNNNLMRQYSASALNSMHDFTLQQQQLQQQQQQQQQFVVPPANEPSIQRVIPSKGPINGGIEVTLLGSRFKQGLVVKFGNNVALSTQCWSETTILTYLPPAMTAGQVFVTITDPTSLNNSDANNNNGFNDSDTGSNSTNIHPSQKAIFTYVDETDRQLIELALQIVGLKMNGKLEDAKNIAKRIVDDDGKSPSGNQNNSSTPSNTQNHAHNISMEDDEQLIIKVIQSLNKTTSNLSMCDDQGRTLLHLAGLKGYTRLVATLVKSGVYVDYKDKYGFTPIHFAAVGGNFKIIRLLLACQSDCLAMTDNGMTAKKLYCDNHGIEPDFEDVLDLFDYYMDLGMPVIDRKMSQTSFDSSIFENESTSSLTETIEPQHQMLRGNTRGTTSDGSDFDHDYDAYEEEFGLSDDESESIGDEDISYDDSYSGGDDSIINSASELDENNEEENGIATEDDNVTSHNETQQDESSQQEEPSAWNKLLTRINEDLPKYDDLYPGNWQPFRGNNHNNDNDKIKEITSINEDTSSTLRRRHLSVDTHHSVDLHPILSSSEDEEDAIQKRFNQFFQNNRLAMHKDKMLLFFWLPVMILLLTLVLWLQFSNDNNDFINKINGWVQHYVAIGLAKIVLGNRRVQTVFRDSINNLQTSGILNDLIVS